MRKRERQERYKGQLITRKDGRKERREERRRREGGNYHFIHSKAKRFFFICKAVSGGLMK